MNYEAAVREIELAIAFPLQGEDAKDAIAAILHKYFPGPNLIESGPLPDGRMVIGWKPGRRFLTHYEWSTAAADAWREDGWMFYDYGPLPPPPGVEP